jgi:hypothetical protein
MHFTTYGNGFFTAPDNPVDDFSWITSLHLLLRDIAADANAPSAIIVLQLFL